MHHERSILVADDDKNDVSMITHALGLGAQESGGVQTVSDGAEALDYLFARGAFKGRPPGNPDVVLLDLKMPRVDGWEVLRQVKSDPTLKTIPVIVFSSSARETDILQSYQLGANAYVVKPISFHEFVETVGHIKSFWMVCNVAASRLELGEDAPTARAAGDA
jgi:CheY-like chemotaxis protein